MRNAVFIVCLLFSTIVLSQERLGLQTGKYAGVSSLSLNPAGHLANPLRWDFNLASAGFFFDNNYSFIRNASILDLYKARKSAVFESSDQIEGEPSANVFVFDFPELNRSRYAWMSAFANGPSLAFKFNEKHSFGFFTAARFVAGSQEIPNNLSYFKYLNRPLAQPFQLHPATAALLGWMEVGLNYALNIQDESGDIGVGLNLRWLRAYEGAFIHISEEFQVTKTSAKSLRLREFRGSFGYTNSNLNNDGFKPSSNGNGLGFDFGFVKFFDKEGEDYRLMLGASIIDLGFISFGKNAELHKVTVDSVANLAASDYEIINGVDEFPELLRTFSRQTMGDSLASFSDDRFSISLPGALSLQADFALSNNVSLNAVLVQRLRPFRQAAERTNILAFTPRFETRWFAASLPLVLLNYDQVNIGLAFRLGFITLGSDNVLGLWSSKNLSGTDIYAAVKVNPFDLGLGGNGKGKSKKGVKCYDF